VPEVSRFFGIVIFLNYNDHQPPHFHARYAGDTVVVGITSLTVLAGSMKARALGLVLEWAARHKAEILEDWDRARRGQPLLRIDPLE